MPFIVSNHFLKNVPEVDVNFKENISTKCEQEFCHLAFWVEFVIFADVIPCTPFHSIDSVQGIVVFENYFKIPMAVLTKGQFMHPF